MKTTFTISLPLIVLSVLVSLSFQTIKAQAEQPNIVLIIVDDLGYKDLACYGSSFHDTPSIDQLASEGILFTNGYASCTVCSPTRSSILTGKYPVKTGVTNWIKGHGGKNADRDRFFSQSTAHQLAFEEYTIAEALRDSGYGTFFAGKWHLGETEDSYPEFHGYDINIGGYSSGGPKSYTSPYNNPRLIDGPDGELLPDRLTDETINYIKTAPKDKPFFTTLSFYAVHTTLANMPAHTKYEARATERGLDDLDHIVEDVEWMSYADRTADRYIERVIQGNAMYASMVERVDYNVGRLLKALTAEGLDDNTVVIFTSDNGGLSSKSTCNLPLRAGKGFEYEGGIRIPVIFRYPGGNARGITSQLPMSSIDLYPTLLSLAGVELPDTVKDEVDGIDLSPYLENESLAEDRPLYWHFPHYHASGADPGSIILYQGYKLFDNFETGNKELYYLPNDTSEVYELSGQMPAKVTELYAMLENWRAETGALMMEENPSWNGEDVNREVIPSYPIYNTVGIQLSYEDGTEVIGQSVQAGVKVIATPLSNDEDCIVNLMTSKYVDLKKHTEDNTFSFIMPMSHVYLETNLTIPPSELVHQFDTTGLLGYFSFNAVSDGKVYCDLGRGKGKGGTLIGGAQISDDSKINKGLVLDGEDDYVSFDAAGTAPFSLAGANNATLACWVKATDTQKGEHQNIIALGDHQYCLKLNGKNLWTGYFYTDNWNSATHQATASDNNQWVHLTVTKGDFNRLYVNGVEAQAIAVQGAVSDDPLHTAFELNFGRDSEHANRFFGGSIDEVFIFNRTLSACEISKLLYLEPEVPSGIRDTYVNSDINVAYLENEIRITNADVNKGKLDVFNLSGIRIATYQPSHNAWSISTTNITPGVYIVRLYDAAGVVLSGHKVAVR